MRQYSEPDRATTYAQAVIAGRIIAGKPVRRACERHLNDLRDGHKRGLKFDLAAANKALKFIEKFLTLPETDSLPFIVQPAQAFIVGCLFGWKKADGFRRFRTGYVEMGKGNGKSPLAAAIALFGLIADGEIGAQIFSAAVNKDQAKVVWNDAEKMVAGSRELSAVIKRTVNNLAYTKTGSYFRPVSAEKRGLDGKRPHMAIVDELHEHPTPIVVNKMVAGFKFRKQPLVLEITNSGYDRESVCWKHHEYSLRILEGNAANDSWFAYVCALDEGDDWKDPKVWIKTNPLLGVSIQDSYLAEQVKQGLDIPSEENIVKRLNFCVWTEQATRAVPMEQWDQCAAAVEIEHGEPCFPALDMASKMDKAAFVLVFPPNSGKPWRLLPFYWVPEKQIEERAQRGDVTYRNWRDAGVLKATKGDLIDFDIVKADILELATKYNFVEVPKDPWNSTQIGTQLKTEGVNIIDFPQTMSHYTAPTKEFLAVVASRDLAHGGHPVLRADMAALAVMQDSNGNKKPDRDASGGSIDGAVCSLMGMGRAMVTQETRSAYDQGASLYL